jgi:formate dehydrogenase beta subunit
LIGACAGGRKAAQSIDKMINGRPLDYEMEDWFDKLFKSVGIYDPAEDLGDINTQPRRQLRMLEPERRKFIFDEVEEGFSTPEAIAEAGRCLRCYRVAMVAV